MVRGLGIVSHRPVPDLVVVREGGFQPYPPAGGDAGGRGRPFWGGDPHPCKKGAEVSRVKATDGAENAVEGALERGTRTQLLRPLVQGAAIRR